jgi:hypothetical protein
VIREEILACCVLAHAQPAEGVPSCVVCRVSIRIPLSPVPSFLSQFPVFDDKTA